MKNSIQKRVSAVLMCLLRLLTAALPVFAGGDGSHEHKWAPAYAADSQFHWIFCINDGCPLRNPQEMKNFGPHVYDESGLCTVCHYQKELLENTIRAVDAVTLYGPAPIEGEGGDSSISSTGLGCIPISWNWGTGFYGMFKQSVPYTLTVYLQATNHYIFSAGFNYVFYNGFFAGGQVELYNPVTKNDVSGFQNAKVTIQFNPTPPITVAGLKAKTAGMRKVDLTWDFSYASDGYLILRNGKQIGFTSEAHYTDNSADPDAFNYYWVIPFSKYNGILYKGNVGNYVWAIGRKIAKPAGVKAISHYIPKTAGALLSWNAVEGANSYIIYSRSGKTGMPTYKAETIALQFQDIGGPGELRFYWVYGIYRDKNGNIVAAGPMSDYAWAVLN